MTQKQLSTIAADLGLPHAHITGAAALFEEGAGIPFIARYRKEQTGGLDEEQLRRLRDRMQELGELDTRRRSMLDSLTERGLLTNDLAERLEGARTKSALEDIYLPFRPKRRTRASKARDRGLEPLASWLLTVADGGQAHVDPLTAARKYVDAAKEVTDGETALAGARDIIAEWISEDAALRAELRELFRARAELSSRRAPRRSKAAQTESKAGSGGDDAAELYRDYFDRRETAKKAPSHRILAVFRGEREGVLTVHVLAPEERALELVTQHWLPRPARARRAAAGDSASGAGDPAANGAAVHKQIAQACEDSYKRLLAPSLETEAKADLKGAADATAATVFAQNLQELLLAAALGERPVLAVDPGFRTGCKVVCLDRHGELLHHEAIYPLEPHNKRVEAARRIRAMIADYGSAVIAVGNGTGGREAAAFLKETLAAESSERADGVSVITVNEAGASVYSASPAARAEFPDQDLTVRGAVSIGRRLMDPLAELVKIDPKSIGVGQYQHDLDQKLLDRKLRDTVVSCVNAVGVDLNTASPHLLQYVSGISARIATAIPSYRHEHGGFAARAELHSVPGLGQKSFEQAAGFLRVRSSATGEAAHPLDASGVHPERYPLVETMARDLGAEIGELIGNEELIVRINLQKYVDEATSRATLEDILAELRHPGRDPRPPFEVFAFSEDVHDIADLREGMRLPGVVTNVTNFGAFVDIGVHRDGLIHVSKLAERFVSDPRELVRVNQQLTVTVVELDTERKRIGLSLVD